MNPTSQGAGETPAADTEPITPTTEHVAVAELDTQVGRIALAGTSVGIAAVSWGSADTLVERLGLPVIEAPDRLADTITALRAYFDGQPGTIRVPLDWRLTRGTQRTVLRTLYETVDYGRSVTYGDLAARCGDVVPARAIGGIMGSNPLPIVVPCHRVLAHDGLGGYSGGGEAVDGLAVKRWLLAMEGVLPLTLDWSLEHGPGQSRAG